MKRNSLRSILFRFLLAVESESQGEVARTHGARAKRETELPLPPATNVLSPLSSGSRATPACLKGNGKDCYAG